jgi:hypothetical protein
VSTLWGWGRGKPIPESKGLRHIGTGAFIGIAAGIIGLVLPLAIILLATYSPGALALTGAQLIEVTAVVALLGAVLFAISLTVYRWGFSVLSRFDHRFWTASALCWCGTIGILLLVLAVVIALASSDTIASCVQGAPSHALTCVRSAAPLASWSGLVGFWLAWLGGLGIVVGIGLTGDRYREGWLFGGAALYALLLLGLIAPGLALLFPINPPTVILLAAPILALLAPVATSDGSLRASQRRTLMRTGAAA